MKIETVTLYRSDLEPNEEFHTELAARSHDLSVAIDRIRHEAAGIADLRTVIKYATELLEFKSKPFTITSSMIIGDDV